MQKLQEQEEEVLEDLDAAMREVDDIVDTLSKSKDDVKILEIGIEELIRDVNLFNEGRESKNELLERYRPLREQLNQLVNQTYDLH